MTNEWRSVALVSIGASMSSLDLTLMFVAFPEIQNDFPHVPRAEVAWVLTSFTIVAAALLIPAGRFADRLGRKRIFLTSLLLFTFGSACVGLAPSVPLIIAARVVQATGGAMLTPSSLAIIMSSVDPSRRSAAIGMWSAISGTVTSAAPTLGAVAIQFGSWRLAFLMVVPIGLGCFVLGRRWLVESVDPNAGPMPDPFGSVLVFVGVAALVFAIVQSREWGWADARTGGVLAFAVAVGFVFVQRCKHHPTPVINFDIFRTGSFRVNAVAAVVVGFAFWGVYGVLVALLTRGWGYSVLAAGLLLTPMTFASTLISFKGGVLMDRRGHRAVMVPAAACFSLGALVLLFFAHDKPNIVFVWLPAAVLIGITSAVYFIGVNSAASRTAPAAHFGVVAGVVQTLIRIGGAAGAAFGVSLVTGVKKGDPVSKFNTAWWALAIAGVICMVAGVASQPETKSDYDSRARYRYGPALVTADDSSFHTVHGRVGVVRAPGHVDDTLQLIPTPELLVHGCVRISALVLMVDMSGGFAAHRDAAPDWTFTSDLSVRMAAVPAPPQIMARARILRAGRGSMMTEVRMSAGETELAFGYAGFNRQPRRVGDPMNPDIDEASRRWGKYLPLDLPLLDAVGIQVVDAAAGHVEVELQDGLRNPAGAMQGAMVSIVGEAAAEALLRHHGSDHAVVTEIDIRYLAMGRVGPIRSAARFVADDQRGPIVVEVYDCGQHDRLMSTMLVRASSVG